MIYNIYIMSFFTKIKDGANRFFSKLNTDKNLFHKIGNSISNATRNVGRVGQLLVPLVSAYNPAAGAALGAGVELAKGYGNDLEKVSRDTAKFHQGTFKKGGSLIPNVDYL